MTLVRKRMGHGSEGKAYADYEVDDVSGKITAIMYASLTDKPFEVAIELPGVRTIRRVIPAQTNQEVRFNIPKAQQPLESQIVKRMAEPAL